MNKINFEIIYEDAQIIVCHKPAQIATQTRRMGQQDMESLLKNYRADKGEEPYIGIVHRLDQPVEGVMVFAKTPRAAADLSEQVRSRSIGKHYLALAPIPLDAKTEGTLTDYLLADKRHNVTTVAKKGTPQAKIATLSYRILQTDTLLIGTQKKEIALYDIHLETGRHHQIRVQFAHMGCPLLGDGKYGAKPECMEQSPDAPCRTSGKRTEILALCAYRVEFVHPESKETMEFSVRPYNEMIRGYVHNHTGSSAKNADSRPHSC